MVEGTSDKEVAGTAWDTVAAVVVGMEPRMEEEDTARDMVAEEVGMAWDKASHISASHTSACNTDRRLPSYQLSLLQSRHQ